MEKIKIYSVIGMIILATIAAVIIKSHYANQTEQIKNELPSKPAENLTLLNEKYLDIVREAMTAKDSSICFAMKNQAQKDMCLDAIDCVSMGVVKEKTKCGNRSGVYMMPFVNNTNVSQPTIEPSKDTNSCAKIANETTKKACKDWVLRNLNSP